jgi:hypothetical protein
MPSIISIPAAVRQDLADSIEEIGQALGLLRESIADADHGNIPSAQLCASDALEIVSSLETRYSQLAAKLATWVDLDPQSACQS